MTSSLIPEGLTSLVGGKLDSPPNSILNPIDAVDQHDRVFYLYICPIIAPYFEYLVFLAKEQPSDSILIDFVLSR